MTKTPTLDPHGRARVIPAPAPTITRPLSAVVEPYAIEIIDMRAEQRNPPRNVAGKATSKRHRGKAVSRAPSQVDAVVLHQTACALTGPKRYQRALHVAAHAVAYPDGVGVLSAPPAWYMNHGNALNARSLGLEVVGLFSGLLDVDDTPEREDLDTTWQRREPAVFDERAIETARATLRALVETGREWGAPLRYLLAHRQSSPTRRSDPGEAIWRALAPWAEEQLGLVALPDLVVDDGRPIPIEWDARGVGRY